MQSHHYLVKQLATQFPLYFRILIKKNNKLFERDDNGKVSIYNRFLDQFFEYSKCDNFFDYITNNALKNNFVYLRSPRRIEGFTMEFGAQRAALDIDELEQLSKIIAHNVHEDFYPVELVKKGGISFTFAHKHLYCKLHCNC
jgi:hypothetical protein